MGLTLYDLNDSYKNVIDLIENGAEGESLEIALSQIEEAIEEKADNYAVVIKKIESGAEMLKAEENRLKSKRQAMENSIKRMKKLLEESMILQGKKKFKTDKFSFNIQKNRPSVIIESLDLLPDEVVEVRTERVPDKKAIENILKVGKFVEGARLEYSESLRIR